MHLASTSWLALLALGAAHGINPAMGWLFAVGRGLQERDRRAMLRALGPLAVGHALAIVVAIAVAMSLGRVLPQGVLKWVVAASLLVVGIDGVRRHRHVRLGGMRVNARELATWSFLMASAHGAGLMVLPFVVGHGSMSMDHDAFPVTGSAAGIANLNSTALTAALIHTLGYLLVTLFLAVIVYEKLGLRVLRTAWINVNAIWSVALIAAALASVLG